MNGTEWTEPGQGATVIDLLRSINRSKIYHKITTDEHPIGHLWNVKEGARRIYRTNLRLTGAPLTADDLKRIAECK